MNQTELVMRRRNVAAFIEADPIKIALTRPGTEEKTAAGGFVHTEPTVLAEQQFRIVLNKRRYTAGIVNSEAGEIPHTDYLLIGNYNKDVQVDDTFVWLGENYSVTGRYLARQESILCSIDILGLDNHGEQQ